MSKIYYFIKKKIVAFSIKLSLILAVHIGWLGVSLSLPRLLIFSCDLQHVRVALVAAMLCGSMNIEQR